MYKVLIVDDEMLARLGIKSLIPWEENGFIVEGEAEDGKQAYDWIMEHSVDIVITDIKMPVMNGIELIRKTREKNPYIQFIVLSSYNDFEYVRQALKSGAADYLIKLEVTPELLLEQLKKIASSIEKERQEKPVVSPIPVASGTSSRDKARLQDIFFRDLLFGWIRSEPEYKERLADLDAAIPDPHAVTLLMFRTEGSAIYEKYREDESGLLKYAILNMLNEIAAKEAGTYAVAVEEKEFAILQYSETIGKKAALARADRTAKIIMDTLNQYFNLSVTIAVSEPFLTYDGINQAYRQADSLLNRRFAASKESPIHYAGQNMDRESESMMELTAEIQQLEKSVELRQHENVARSLEKVKGLVSRSCHIPHETIKGCCSAIIYLLSFRFEEDSSSWLEEQLMKLDKMTRKAEFLSWLDMVSREWDERHAGLTKSSRLIADAQRYIRSNYSMDITLESMADYLNLSPAYFSNLFKKETGENFVEYLTKVRIGQAKLLLRTSDQKIYEVGRLVGYENEHYFSRVFKKVTGRSPLQFKTMS